MAEVYGCRVTGIDLSPEFCATAQELSRWLGLADQVTFRHGDATALTWEPGTFDAAMTIHAVMNIAAKHMVYAAVHRALKAGRIFAAYDILQGKGGEVNYPMPWARNPAISHLSTPDEMRALLQSAGFRILDEVDSTEQSEAWFKETAAQMATPNRSPVGLRQLLGEDAATNDPQPGAKSKRAAHQNRHFCLPQPPEIAHTLAGAKPCRCSGSSIWYG